MLSPTSYRVRTARNCTWVWIPVVNSKRCELPDDRRMIDELRRLERRRGRTGKDSIDHPAHLSDDLANSTAGVINLVITKAPMSKNAIPTGVGRGLGAELRQAFGPLAMDKPSQIPRLVPLPKRNGRIRAARYFIEALSATAQMMMVRRMAITFHKLADRGNFRREIRL